MKTSPLLWLTAGLVGGVLLAGGALLIAHRQGALHTWLPGPASTATHDADDHDEIDDHADADPHDHAHDAGHDHGSAAHEDEPPIEISEEVMREVGVRVQAAGPRTLQLTRSLSGEVLLNPERLAHIVPRVGGIVRDVRQGIGDQVAAGDVMAVLESRELAEAKARYLAARQRATVAEATLRADQELRARGVVADLDFIAVERDVAEARIALRAADVRLHTYGLTHDELDLILQQDEEELLIYELRAPFSGRVVERHIALGELVTTTSDVFLLADLRTVWVDLTVYPQDLAHIRPGQTVTVTAPSVGQTTATIEYLSPLVEETTRTASARATLANPDGTWRPGLFVTAEVVVERVDAAVAIPRQALQMLDGQTVVFVEVPRGFAPRAVRLGQVGLTHVEVLSGLAAGTRLATEGAFLLKAEHSRESFAGDGHAH